MKVAVVCANGRVGSLVVKEAVERGVEVTAVVREENRSIADKVIQKDLFDLTKADSEGFDAVVDAFGVWQEEELSNHSKSLKHLCDLCSGKKTRLLVVGGAGSLYVNPEHTANCLRRTGFSRLNSCRWQRHRAKLWKSCEKEMTCNGPSLVLLQIFRQRANVLERTSLPVKS